MSQDSNLFELFGPTSLKRWERLIAEGGVPSKQQLADILEANTGEPLPAWLVILAAKALRGEQKQRAGRPSQSAFKNPILACGKSIFAGSAVVAEKGANLRARRLVYRAPSRLVAGTTT